MTRAADYVPLAASGERCSCPFPGLLVGPLTASAVLFRLVLVFAFESRPRVPLLLSLSLLPDPVLKLACVLVPLRRPLPFSPPPVSASRSPPVPALETSLHELRLP